MGELISVHTVNSIHARDGGPARSVTSLCSELADESVGVKLITARDQDPEGHVLPRDGVEVSFYSRALRAGYHARTEALRSTNEAALVLHDHGIWLTSNVLSAIAAKRLHVPLVVSTRGMLEPWAMSYRAWKKKVAWQAYQKRVLMSAAVLHATSAAELEGIRGAGLKNPVAVIPNGVSLPSNTDIPSLQSNRDTTGRKAFFLSRVHPKKGLPMLLEAWHRMGPQGWELVIAGPDEVGHTGQLKTLVDRYGLQNDVRFVGPVDDAAKWRLYAESDLFILPTHSENFGIVVAEAMAAGLPVVTTKGAPWSVLSERQCGWWTDMSADAIEAALREAMSMSPEQRHAMGERGARYVREHLSWPSIARQMREVYEWVLFGGAVPSTVALV